MSKKRKAQCNHRNRSLSFAPSEKLQTSDVYLTMKERNFMNVTKFNDTIKHEDGADIKFSWDQINWKQTELYINRFQTGIVKTTHY